MKLMQWEGDAVLARRMRRLVVEKAKQDPAPIWEIERLSALSVGNASLGDLCDKAAVPAMLRLGRTLQGKQRADIMEAIIFRLDEVQETGGPSSDMAARATSSIMEALCAIGRRRAVRDLLQDHPRNILERHRAWLKSFATKDREEPYTHSSLFGGKDWVTETGRLHIPDTEEMGQKLSKAVVDMHNLDKPLCFVEMTTQRYPFFEDIDIMGTCSDGPPSELLGNDFWSLRAEVLHEMYPSLESIDLTLFTAHGFQKEKDCYKASFHAVWNNIIVDKCRAAAVRLATIQKFNQESTGQNGRMYETKRRLLKADDRNSWEAVFDQASVFGGSFRMPYCDKVHKGGREGRQIMPEAAWRCTFRHWGIHFEVLHQKEDLAKEEWAKRGRVRLLPDPTTMDLPPLTKWQQPANFSLRARQAKPSSCSGGSMGSLATRQQAKDKRAVQLWEEEQRLRRRLWRGEAREFKARLDACMGDADGLQSSWMEIQAKRGMRRWSWVSPRLKGVVEIQEPTGEVFLRGSSENQVVLLDVVRQFTEEWRGPIPKMKGSAKGNISGKGKKKGKAKGGHCKGKLDIQKGSKKGGAAKSRMLPQYVRPSWWKW